MENKELESIIEKSLRTEPDFYLSVDFAQKVSNTIVRRKQWKSDFYEYLYLTGVIVLLLSVVSGLYYYIEKEFVMTFVSILSGNIIQAILVVFLLNFILFADRVLLPLLFSCWNINE